MNKVISGALFLFLVLISSLAHAGEWASKQTVYRVYPHATKVYVQTAPSSAHLNPDGCITKSNYQMDPENPMFDKQYQALLTALAAQRKVSLYISGCIGSYPRISHVIMY